MGAVVFQRATAIVVNKRLEELARQFRKPNGWKHATDLSHTQKLHFCRSFASMHIRFFGIISYKPTLGGYADQINWEPHKFYNKCAKYLLERVGAYLSGFDGQLSEPSVVFEDRNHDYDAMIRYLSKVKENPIYPQSKALNSINPFGITSRKKGEEPLLKVADLVSHTLYSCVNKTPDNFQITEPRYLNELSPRFASDERGDVLETGIKPIHSISDLCLGKDVEQVLRSLKGQPKPTRQGFG